RPRDPAAMDRSYGHLTCSIWEPAALRPQGPRSGDDPHDDERGHDLADWISNGGMRRGGAGEVEEHSGVRPLFQPRCSGYEDGDAAEELPHTQDQNEIIRITQGGHQLHDGVRPSDVGRAPRQEDEGGEPCRDPVSDLSRLHRKLLITSEWT